MGKREIYKLFDKKIDEYMKSANTEELKLSKLHYFRLNRTECKKILRVYNRR